MSFYLAALVTASALVGATEAPPTAREDIDAFIREMAGKHGFDRAELRRAFERAKFRPKIVELMERAAEPTPWSDYRSLFVKAEKIEGGGRFWRANRKALELARAKYGVPEEIVTAVIGVETHYGRNTGNFKVLEALATLAFRYPRRASMFRLELEHYLLLAREESMVLAKPRGSYAGAMGIAQFMPGSYRRYAVDFDGDGKRDLFDNATDAIGSVANYLTAHGWQRDEPVAVPASVTTAASAPFRGSDLSKRYSLEELSASGVSLSGAFPSDSMAIPLTLSNRDGAEYWLGFENFYVITRYNRSVYYAMAVYQLSEELRRRHEARSRAGDR